MTMREGPAASNLSEIQPAPRPSDEQGVGKSPGFRWPWQRTFQALVPKQLKQGAVGATAAGRINPERPERKNWAGSYLLYYEQEPRHVWPSGPGRVIEHDEGVPLVAVAPRL